MHASSLNWDKASQIEIFIKWTTETTQPYYKFFYSFWFFTHYLSNKHRWLAKNIKAAETIYTQLLSQQLLLSYLSSNVFTLLRCMIKNLRQNQLLMNRLPYVITQYINRLLFSSFFLEKNAFDLIFCSLQRDSPSILSVKLLLK